MINSFCNRSSYLFSKDENVFTLYLFLMATVNNVFLFYLALCALSNTLNSQFVSFKNAVRDTPTDFSTINFEDFRKKQLK